MDVSTHVVSSLAKCSKPEFLREKPRNLFNQIFNVSKTMRIQHSTKAKQRHHIKINFSPNFMLPFRPNVMTAATNVTRSTATFQCIAVKPPIESLGICSWAFPGRRRKTQPISFIRFREMISRRFKRAKLKFVQVMQCD